MVLICRSGSKETRSFHFVAVLCLDMEKACQFGVCVRCLQCTGGTSLWRTLGPLLSLHKRVLNHILDMPWTQRVFDPAGR
jgi:hypothetical protein